MQNTYSPLKQKKIINKMHFKCIQREILMALWRVARSVHPRQPPRPPPPTISRKNMLLHIYASTPYAPANLYTWLTPSSKCVTLFFVVLKFFFFFTGNILPLVFIARRELQKMMSRVVPIESIGNLISNICSAWLFDEQIIIDLLLLMVK